LEYFLEFLLRKDDDQFIVQPKQEDAMARSMDELMAALSPYHDTLDKIGRAAHATYRTYDPAHLLDHTSTAQATNIHSHAIAEASRRFLDDPNILSMEIRRLQVWIFKAQEIVLRFKKMDEDGLSQNIKTKQQIDFDAGKQLPGLPYPPERLTFGYLLDRTGTIYERTQIAQPQGKSVIWCAAIVPEDSRDAVGDTWIDITRQRSTGL
jgi:hypothetical protein